MIQSGPMAAPTPARLSATVALVRHLLSELEDEYRWAHDIAFAPSSTSAVRIGGTRNRGSGDATGNSAIGDDPTRERMEHVAKRLAAFKDELQELRNTLLPRPNVTAERPDRFPRTVTKQEREESQSAQARRVARGQGWGSG